MSARSLNDWTIVRRSLAGRGLSTTLTVVSVGVAVALMLVLLGSGRSADEVFRRGSGNMHMLVSGDASPMTGIMNNVYYANAPRAAFPLRQFDQFWQTQRLPVAWRVPTALGDSYRGLRVLATEPNFFTDFEPNVGEPWEIAEGRFLDPDGENPFEVVLGAEAARLTGLAVDDEIYLTHGPGSGKLEPAEHDGGHHHHDEVSFTVVGIARPTASAHDRVLFTTLTATWLTHATDARRSAQGPDTPFVTEDELQTAQKVVTGVLTRVATREGRDGSAAIQQVFNRFRANPAWTVAQPAQEQGRLLRMIEPVQNVLLMMAVVVFVSSGLGILLSLYNSMEQRRRQVAVLRVLGASRGRVFGLVLTESAVIGALGAVVGLVGSIAASGLVTGLFRDQYGVVLELDLLGPAALTVCLGAVILAMLAGILPAALAYRASVSRGLRPLG